MKNDFAPIPHRLNRLAAAAALLTALALASPAFAGSAIGATPEDLNVANSVQAALLKDRAFQAPNVDIVVRAWQGKVNLSGWIGDTGDDSTARKIAAGVSGVKSVTSNLRSWSSEPEERSGQLNPSTPSVRPPSLVGATPADMTLASNVQSALLKERVFQAADVDLVVRASNGKVNLSGWIGDTNDTALARRVTAAVPGVTKVSTNLRSWSTESEEVAMPSGKAAAPAPASVSGATPADLQLATNVRAAVMQSPRFQESDVDIVVRAARGRVNLSGWISYAGNDMQARKIASEVPGVTKVTSDFKSWSTESDPRP